MKLTAAIITYNEEGNIERCIRSLLPVADEVFVVDSFSTDRTKEICLELGARFIEHPFQGHIQQKNYALENAAFDWVLSLDADEALTEELQQSILKIKSNPQYNGYRFNRLTNYCGHWVKYCGWYPDTKVRLVRKIKARWMGTNPHDRLDMISGEATGFLEGDLLHYSYNSRDEHYKQIEYFGDIAAKELFEQGKTTSYFMIITKVTAQFIKSFFIKKGFLDGRTGFTISRLSAYATYRKYIKLLKLQRNA
ncbi:glycosyltransferase family 2 protein [Fluviicola sp. SGL-29]|nr:glycosyltransferase family 2 protein [Fluviicola sp. SGL-29]